MGFRVAVVYNLRRGGGGWVEAEYDAPATVDAIAAALAALGHEPVCLEADRGLWDRLRGAGVDIAFNLAEGLGGDAREAHVPAMLEMLGIPYTGSRVLTLAVCLHKPTTQRLLRAQGVPVPDFALVPPGRSAVAAVRRAGLRFPLFCKPAAEGSSLGVTESSLCLDEEALRSQVARIHRAFGEAALVEAFVPGREFTVGLVGNGRPRVLPILEINHAAVPPDHPPVYSFRFKKEWDDDRFYLCPAPVSPGLARRLRALALAAYRAVGCLDVGRVDVRLDAAGRPLVLEVNPLPGMAPGFSDLPRMAAAAGMAYQELVGAVLDAAVRRWGLRSRGARRAAAG